MDFPINRPLPQAVLTKKEATLRAASLNFIDEDA